MNKILMIIRALLSPVVLIMSSFVIYVMMGWLVAIMILVAIIEALMTNMDEAKDTMDLVGWIVTQPFRMTYYWIVDPLKMMDT